jgi:ribonuclease D
MLIMDNDTQLPPPIWVDTPQTLHAMVERLRGEPALAIDTESNSLYVYREQLCLVQISVPGADFLVDGLAVTDLAPLEPLLADPAVCKVLHGAEYDLAMLHAHSRLAVTGLFDTMWASRILGWKEHGLAALIQAHFGVALNKKYQRADWGLRPLPAEQSDYARMDTHYLLPLSAIQSRALEKAGRWPQAEHRFAELCLTRWEDHSFDPGGFWRLPGVHELDDVGRGALRRLWALRDRCAQAENRPPFKILPNQVLLALSEVRPMTLPELRRVRGMPQRWVGRYGEALLDAIQQGEGEPIPWDQRPRLDHAPGSQPRGRPTPACQERFSALRAWRNARAEAGHVEPDIILSNHLLWAVAHRNPRQMADLGGEGLLAGWQVEEFGRELLTVVRGANSGRAARERRT